LKRVRDFEKVQPLHAEVSRADGLLKNSREDAKTNDSSPGVTAPEESQDVSSLQVKAQPEMSSTGESQLLTLSGFTVHCSFGEVTEKAAQKGCGGKRVT
jgi:hypothetical protein